MPILKFEKRGVVGGGAGGSVGSSVGGEPLGPCSLSVASSACGCASFGITTSLFPCVIFKESLLPISLSVIMAILCHFMQGFKDMTKLIMMRHGQSQWNLHNLFTGWVDVPLSEKGIEESFAAGRAIKDIPIDVIFTSSLIRAQMSAMLAMSMHSPGRVPVVIHPDSTKLNAWSTIYSSAAEKNCIPTTCAWELNERMYGELQGLNKQETIDKYGAAQVQLWRRSYDVAPPGGESLAMTAARTIPYFQTQIVPQLEQGKNVFISAHGNSLRSILMVLENYSPAQIVALELATGEPLVYDFSEGQYTKVKDMPSESQETA